MKLDCGCCVLRPWREGDESSLVRHANNYEIWRRLRDGFPHPYTHADAERWIAFAKQQNPPTHFAIEVHGEATGGIGLELRSDIERRSAEIGAPLFCIPILQKKAKSPNLLCKRLRRAFMWLLQTSGSSGYSWG